MVKTYSGIIYSCLCIVTNKYYIGQTTTSLDCRKNRHIADSFNPKSNAYDCKFHKEIRELGIDNFQWNILVNISSQNSINLQESLNELEWMYIKKYNSYTNGYNMTRGGDGIRCIDSRKIIQYDVEGNVLKEFNDVHQASEMTKIHIGTINMCLNKQLNFIKKSYDRFVFRYESEEYSKSDIEYNLQLLSDEKIYVFDLDKNLIDTCLNLGKFCNKYIVKINQSRKNLTGETNYLISEKFDCKPIIISKSIPSDERFIKAKKTFNNPNNRSRFYIKVIDLNSNEQKIYSNISKASKELNLNYRIIQRTLGEFKKEKCFIDNYEIINLKYYGS